KRMAQIVIYLDEDDKTLIENVSEFTDLDSTSKFCKTVVLKRARELSNTEEFKAFHEKKYKKIIEREVEEDE
ncbi:MAG: hypothetical protein HGA95_02220, partial [Caldiserica bacterium]|nr:hypothetical protein [Caldisericota bacterium]